MDTRPEESQEQQPKQLKGLYKNVKVSVRTLDIIIIACVLTIFVVAFTGMQNGGFLVTFETNGGSDVESIRLDYGVLIPEPAEPTREGYVFTGWYADYGLYKKWSFSQGTVGGDMTLYAGWEAK